MRATWTIDAALSHVLALREADSRLADQRFRLFTDMIETRFADNQRAVDTALSTVRKSRKQMYARIAAVGTMCAIIGGAAGYFIRN